MKRYLTAAAVAAMLLAGHLSANAQQTGYPPMGYAPQQWGYGPQMQAMLPPGYMIPQQGISLASLQAGEAGEGSDAENGTGCDCCGDPCCCIQTEVYVDFLYLRARNAEVAFAVNTNAVVAPPAVPVQVGPVALVDPDFEPGFRVGARRFIDPCASIGIEYWFYESATANLATGNVADPLQGGCCCTR